MTGGEITRRGILLVLSSPSGAGKTTISRALIAKDRTLKMSVSVTTRPRRPREIEGKHYYFVTCPRRGQRYHQRRRLAGHAAARRKHPRRSGLGLCAPAKHGRVEAAAANAS